ncbi:MAG: amidohydrolase family protein [Pseudomonadales bacterium]|jgi:N-acyl-D-aspartate/D-glutamate deacylase|nr:amidohydrolase family protein [Pseudomonadales bacterium]
MHDLVIRGGSIHDGTGAPAFEGDLAVDDGIIVAVGAVPGRGREEIDARGQLVTPGFVDIHTHFDGQVTWDPFLSPSSFHGVTTAVMGNCGVGFAPCAPERHAWLIQLMEGVEDIPGTALAEGIRWNWESFPEYMDAVAASPLAIDVGLQIPHGALRAYVMGERAARLEPAQAEDIARMRALVTEALQAGALGFTTSRTEKHRDRAGNHTPSFKAEQDELWGIAEAVGATGRGVIQLIADFWDFEPEFALIRGMAEASGRPLSLTIEQDDRHPEIWERVLAGISDAQAAGVNMRGQVPPRPTGVIMGLTATLNPFLLHETYRPLRQAPLEEKVRALRDPAFLEKLFAERQDWDPQNVLVHFLMRSFHKMFELGDPPNYEPAPEDSVAARAAREGRSPEALLVELLLEKDGRNLLYFPIMNYTHGSLDDVRTMMSHPHTLFGLSDAGAHCGTLCDASFPTTTLVHWGRDRRRGDGFDLPWLVHGLTQRTALQVGLADRGRIAPGYLADLNVIDFDHLRLHAPEITHDLPAGGKRLIQRTEGYTATIKSGAVAFREGVPVVTAPDRLRGRLLRGAQGAPTR